MFHTLIMTCGTSFNGNKFSLRKEEYKGGIGKLSGQLYRHGDPTDEERDAIDRWMLDNRNILKEMSADEQAMKISAEFSAVHALDTRGKLSAKPKIILFVTKTIGGFMAERLLRDVFDRVYSADISTVQIEMDVNNSREMNRQIGDYLVKLKQALEQGEPRTTCFIPLGGYKIMTAYGYMIGSFLGYSSYYLQENFHELIEVPRLPVSTDTTFILQKKSFFERFRGNKCLDEDTFNHRERAFVHKHPYLFYRESGLIEMNPFGFFYIDQAGLAYLLSTQYQIEKGTYEKLSSDEPLRLEAYQQMKVLTKKLKQTGDKLTDELAHERAATWHLDQQKVHFHLFKGSSHSSNGVVRMTYSYDKDADLLIIQRIWFDHDQYEKEVSAGIGIYDSKDSCFYHDVTKDVFNILRNA